MLKLKNTKVFYKIISLKYGNTQEGFKNSFTP